MEKDKIYQTDPWMIPYFIDNQIPYLYTYGSSKEVLMKCPRCGYEKMRKIKYLHDKGFACPKCSDGISYPNKFMFNILEQLQIPFKYEISHITEGFEWIENNYRYDFYFCNNTKKYFIEMDGHYHQISQKTKINDEIKNQLAIKHNIEIIRILCNYKKDRFNFIKANILNSKLPKLLNFTENDIDWNKCELYANSSLMIDTCNFWKQGICNILEISDRLHITRQTASTYLKKGSELGLCDYDPYAECQKVLAKGRTLESERKKCKPVAIYNTIGMIAVFDGAVQLSEASEDLFGVYISRPMITNVCRGKNGTNAGLKFQYISQEEYIKLYDDFGGNVNPKLFNSSIKYSSREKPISVFLYGKLIDIFSGRTEACDILTKKYNIPFSLNSIINVCLGRQEQYNGFTFKNTTREEYEQHKMIENNIEVVKEDDIYAITL